MIDEDEVVHIELVGKRKVYSEAAYNRLREALNWSLNLCDAIDSTDDDDGSTSVMFRETLHDIRYNNRAALQEAEG